MLPFFLLLFRNTVRNFELLFPLTFSTHLHLYTGTHSPAVFRLLTDATTISPNKRVLFYVTPKEREGPLTISSTCIITANNDHYFCILLPFLFSPSIRRPVEGGISGSSGGCVHGSAVLNTQRTDGNNTLNSFYFFSFFAFGSSSEGDDWPCRASARQRLHWNV